MPEESINIFINNIYAIAIFTGILLVVFLILFLVSRLFFKRSNHEKSKESLTIKEPKSFILHSDPGMSRTIFAAGLIFINIIFLVLLVFLSIYFATNFRVDKSLYTLILIVFLIILSAAYVIRSGIFRR